MKGKRLLYTPLIAMLVLGMAAVNVGAYVPPSPPPPYAWIYTDPDPKTIFTEANLTGTTFTVDVNIFNVTSLAGYEFKLDWNTSLLNITGADQYGRDTLGNVISGPVNTQAGIYKLIPGVTLDTTYYFAPLKNVTQGWVHAGCVFINPYTGSGTLYTINFTIIKAPPRILIDPPAQNKSVSCVLDVFGLVLSDPVGGSIACGADDGFYEYIRPQIIKGYPDAIFTPANLSSVYVGDDVILDASASTDGGYPPITYMWTVTGNASLTGANNTVTTTMKCDALGWAYVTLNVTNNITCSDEEMHVIEQLEKAGCIIDVFSESEREYPAGTITTKVGKLANVPCDAYAPDEEATLYADVSFNGQPRDKVLVTFEVIAPVLGSIDYLTATTNSSGVAKLTYRIPGATGNDWLFGKWLVIATCSIQDVTQNDTLPFDVGWIVEITDLWTTYDGGNTTTFYTGDTKMDFGVIVKNIALISKYVKIAVIVKDVGNVPIAKFVVTVDSLPAGVYCNPEETYIYMYFATVPDWSYVGAATVYASVLTDTPQNGGIAYCPSMSTGITIKLGPRP